VDRSRPGTDYDGRLARPPEWHPTPEPYRFLCVDGGVMDNEPLELARRYLAGAAGQNPRDGETATRSVIMIDPFPNKVTFDWKWESDPRLIRVAPALFSALTDQARFKPEELALAAEGDCFGGVSAPPRGNGPAGEPRPAGNGRSNPRWFRGFPARVLSPPRLPARPPQLSGLPALAFLPT